MSGRRRLDGVPAEPSVAGGPLVAPHHMAAEVANMPRWAVLLREIPRGDGASSARREEV